MLKLYSSNGVESPIVFAMRNWRMRNRFRRKLGYVGNFEQPQTFEEKIQFRKLYGNHKRYAMMADKYRVRQYVTERVGKQYLVPLLGVYDRLTPDIFADLPDRFIIKANHGCKWHKIVWDKSALDVASTIRYFNRLMKKRYGRSSGEYHYKLIEPKIVIETLLVDGDDSPVDYSLFCYHSEAGFDYAVTISTPRYETIVHFDKHWNIVEGEFTAEQYAKYVRPENFDQMLRIAEALSQGFDFIRIDLYNLDGRIYFGEATCTPGGGLGPAKDPRFSQIRTEMWKLDTENEQLYQKKKSA
ncbi:MAG: hypothetical protein JKY95_12600 [Planctomycetaceae bacterium]|nr:hypothetical protein [Planctomycetaceae bacterium]